MNKLELTTSKQTAQSYPSKMKWYTCVPICVYMHVEAEADTGVFLNHSSLDFLETGSLAEHGAHGLRLAG